MKALLKKLGFKRRDPVAMALYASAVAEARRELYYVDWTVPDTLDGRFDMVSLMTALVNRRIGRVELADMNPVQNLMQDLFDVMFADMDANLREMGVSDEGMKYRINRMVSAHLGRVKAYTDALDEAGPQECEEALCQALKRNVYHVLNGADPRPLAVRVGDLVQQLEACTDETLLAGRFTFRDPAS